MSSPQGNLPWKTLADHVRDVAPPVAAAAARVPGARVARIDPVLSDTAAFCAAYDVDPAASANCVVVRGRRGEESTYAAVVVLAPDRADVNKVVRKELGARKVTFAEQDVAQALTGMQSGGITPVGLPPDWPVLIDAAVAAAPRVVVGAGIRGAKLLVSGDELAGLPGARTLELALPR